MQKALLENCYSTNIVKSTDSHPLTESHMGDRTRQLRSRHNLLPETDTARLSLNEAVVMVVKVWISPCILHGTTVLQSLRYNYPRSSV